MKQEGQKIEALIQNQNGEKMLKTKELYPGMNLSFFSVSGQDAASFCHPPLPDVLEINYCISGRIGWHMDNGNQIYLGPGDFSLHTMDVCAHSHITFPNNSYRGLILWVDLKRLSDAPPAALTGSIVTGEFLYEKFCKDGMCTAIAGNEEVQRIFRAFYETPEQLRQPYQKIKVLELLLVLSSIEVNEERQLTQYRSEQVAIIRQIHDRLTEDLSQRASIELLAKQYLINATTLKNMFKSVYGTSIAAHIREHRMEEAAKLLRSTDSSIAQVAAQVGYDSQSRFSAAFKSHYGVLPKEYRREHAETFVSGPADSTG